MLINPLSELKFLLILKNLLVPVVCSVIDMYIMKSVYDIVNFFFLDQPQSAASHLKELYSSQEC